MKLKVDEALQQGVAAHREGKLQDADRLYRAVLRANPSNPDANHNLGVLAIRARKPEEAIPLFKAALVANPLIEQFWFSYIDALVKLERFDEAERVLIEGYKSNVSSEKFEVFQQQIQIGRRKDKNKTKQGLSLKEKRKRIAEKKKVKKRKSQNVLTDTALSQGEITSLLGCFREGRFNDAAELAEALTRRFPEHPFAWKSLGAALKQTGRLTASVMPMRKSVELSPGDAEAHSNLGITLQELGRLAQAEVSLRQAIALKPHYAEAHYNLGITLQDLGRLDDAEVSYRQAIALTPDNPEAHYNLGITVQELDRLDEAEASYRRAIELKPDYPEAHHNLGVSLRVLRRLDDAEVSLRQAVALQPGYDQAWYNLGITLRELGKSDEAETSFRQAITLKPDQPEGHCNLGITLQELGKLGEAQASFRQAIALKPDYPEVHYNLGVTLQELGRLEEAEASYRQALAFQPDHAKAHCNLGVTVQELGRLDEAEASFRQAIVLQPDFAEAHSNLGITLQELGKLDEAEASLREAIVVKPDCFEAHYNLMNLRKVSADDEHFLQAQALHHDSTISEYARRYICFALGKAYDDLEDFENAFQMYAEANALCKKQLDYDKAQDKQLFGMLKASYPRIAAHTFEPEIVAVKPRPIFILGMPRSGTTLVEQIISSHPLVEGAGELAFVSQLGGPLAFGQAKVDGEALKAFRKQYLDELGQRANGKPIVTDKMPQNFRFLGLIAAALPEAKIIHVKRHPCAVCWANYTQFFLKGTALGYCYSLDDIAQYHELYQDLMRYWHQTLPNKVYDLAYEGLTENPEREIRELINHLDLDWDDACLSPQDNNRSVATASNVQVRQRIYQGSSEKWKQYRPYLSGAFDHLSFE